eukprot:CAMPEP_0184871090 /NCGR_PEP_ID=MMETSP0580-20130426/39892_1 /TAXON_ID=1118495 /ORGANISM="Dactyliosolen fragilissimus" /LENGTH=727 /DNA_ID=CAMNT_0027373589 /DNA_START=385 /DNA_END=2568 /DNA_ORIENTATION=+
MKSDAASILSDMEELDLAVSAIKNSDLRTGRRARGKKSVSDRLDYSSDGSSSFATMESYESANDGDHFMITNLPGAMSLSTKDKNKRDSSSRLSQSRSSKKNNMYPRESTKKGGSVRRSDLSLISRKSSKSRNSKASRATSRLRRRTGAEIEAEISRTIRVQHAQQGEAFDDEASDLDFHASSSHMKSSDLFSDNASVISSYTVHDILGDLTDQEETISRYSRQTYSRKKGGRKARPRHVRRHTSEPIPNSFNGAKIRTYEDADNSSDCSSVTDFTQDVHILKSVSQSLKSKKDVIGLSSPTKPTNRRVSTASTGSKNLPREKHDSFSETVSTVSSSGQELSSLVTDLHSKDSSSLSYGTSNSPIVKMNDMISTNISRDDEFNPSHSAKNKKQSICHQKSKSAPDALSPERIGRTVNFIPKNSIMPKSQIYMQDPRIAELPAKNHSSLPSSKKKSSASKLKKMLLRKSQKGQNKKSTESSAVNISIDADELRRRISLSNGCGNSGPLYKKKEKKFAHDTSKHHASLINGGKKETPDIASGQGNSHILSQDGKVGPLSPSIATDIKTDVVKNGADTHTQKSMNEDVFGKSGNVDFSFDISSPDMKWDPSFDAFDGYNSSPAQDVKRNSNERSTFKDESDPSKPKRQDECIEMDRANTQKLSFDENQSQSDTKPLDSSFSFDVSFSAFETDQPGFDFTNGNEGNDKLNDEDWMKENSPTSVMHVGGTHW